MKNISASVITSFCLTLIGCGVSPGHPHRRSLTDESHLFKMEHSADYRNNELKGTEYERKPFDSMKGDPRWSENR